MSADITRAQRLPAACRHCGGVLKEYVDRCPYCGASRPLERAALRVRSRSEAVATSGSSAGAPPAQNAVTPADHPTIKADYQHHAALEHAPGQIQRRAFPKVLLLVLLFLALAYAAYLMLGGARKPGDAGDAGEGQGIHSLVGKILPYLPRSRSSPSNTNSSADTPPADVPKPVAVPQFKDVPDSLRAAHAGLATNDLSDAKAADEAALAHDAQNSDALAIQRDIAAREQRRDSALQNADRCVNQRDWGCVQQQASEALAIDSSSQQAQSLMERAILSTAWAPAASGAAAPAASAPTPTHTPAAANDSGADARERAILQNGWKSPAQPGNTQ